MLTSHYYCKSDPGIRDKSFSGVLKKCGEEKRKLDKIGITQFVLFNYPLYRRTFLKDIKYAFINSDGNQFHFRYKNERSMFDYSKKNEEMLWNLLSEIVKKITIRKDLIYGVGNSGGMDSRVILYLLKAAGVSISAYTLGDMPSDAVFIANVVAQRLAIRNQTVPIECNFLELYWRDVLESRPMYSLLHSWHLSAIGNLPKFDIHVTGFNGDNMLGSHLTKHLTEIKDLDELYRYIYTHYMICDKKCAISIIRKKELIEDAYDDFYQNISICENSRNEDIFEEFNFMCRQLRFIKNVINFDYCGRTKWVSPFFNEDFLRFALTLTFAERYKRRLCLRTIYKYMPELRHIRFERKCYAPYDQLYPYLLTFKKLVWKVDQKLKLGLYFKGNHKDVKKWMAKGESLRFIENQFKTSSAKFQELFDVRYIIDNLVILFEKELNLLLNLLTVNLWLKTYME